MKEQKGAATVSRLWNHPQIETRITLTGIALSMSLEDFLHALAQEAGSPALLLTVGGLEARLLEASGRVVAGIKEESAKVV